MSRRIRPVCWFSLGLSVLFFFAPAASLGQTITGQAIDATTDAPVKGAVVVLTTPDGNRLRTTQTDSLGRYTLVDLDSAQYVIKARRVGYEVSTGGPFTLSSTDTLSINLALRPTPVAMEEVTVSAEVKRKLQDVGFYDRKERGAGSFIERKEIEESSPSKPSEVFGDVQGMRMMGQIGAGIRPFIKTTGRSTLAQGGSDTPCVPTIVIDGIVAREGQIIDLSRTQRLNDLVSISDIQAMEVYPRSHGAPPQYGGTSSPCGVVLIWTGRGN